MPLPMKLLPETQTTIRADSRRCNCRRVGQFAYNYSGGTGGINCADGSTAGFTKVTPDGTWTYTHSVSGNYGTTQVTAPDGSYTIYNFSGPYVVQRQVFSSSGTLIDFGAAMPPTANSWTRERVKALCRRMPATVKCFNQTGTGGSSEIIIRIFSIDYGT